MLVILSSAFLGVPLSEEPAENGTAVVFYDHAMTMGDEVNYIWHRRIRLTGTCILFTFNRLVVLVYGVSMVMQIFYPASLRVCANNSRMHSHSHLRYFKECTITLLSFYSINIVLCLTATGLPSLPYFLYLTFRNFLAFASLRAYALSERNFVVAAAVTLLGLGAVSINIVGVVHASLCYYTEESPV